MIFLFDKKVIIQGYQKILKVSENEIVFMMFKKTYIIKGNNMSLPFFEKDEFSIIGDIEGILIC